MHHLHWRNIIFLTVLHTLACWSLLHLSRANVIWGVTWFMATGLSITGGYHRLFAHATYKAQLPLRLFYLLFGAAAVQNSALKWCADHRRHHAFTDTDRDPYNIRKGFWWAHIGWLLVKTPAIDTTNVHDLKKDLFVRLQHRYYVAIVIATFLIPPLIAEIGWGDFWGAFLVRCLFLVCTYHATFAVNSLAHYLGGRPHSLKTSARDSWITALVTFGEGYHNFHHTFQYDYRNGIRWYHFDPTKWFIWTASTLRITWKLRRRTLYLASSA